MGAPSGALVVGKRRELPAARLRFPFSRGESHQMNATGSTPVLSLKGVSKSFGPVQALSDVNFEVRPGEVVALVGDNGAGKSTLVKVIAGIHPADDGSMEFEGEDVHITSPTDAVALGIATVYQDLALCDNLDVVENLFLGREKVADGPA